MIRVHIERLVVDGAGVGPTGVEGLRRAVEERLAGELAEHGVAPDLRGGAALVGLDGPDIALGGLDGGAASAPAAIGNRLALGLAALLAGPVPENGAAR